MREYNLSQIANCKYIDIPLSESSIQSIWKKLGKKEKIPEPEILCKKDHNASPFRRLSTSMWQNGGINSIRCAMVWDVYFSFPKLLQLY